MHILVISRSYPNKIDRSSGNFVKNQVQALSKHSLKVGVLGVYNISVLALLKLKNFTKLGFYSKNKNNFCELGFLYPVMPKLHFINNKIKFVIGKWLFKKYIKKFGKPGLIHLHTFEMGAIAIWAKKKYNIPYLVTEHISSFYLNEALTWHKELAQKVYGNSAYNIGVSKSSSQYLEEKFKAEFNYIPNFVDTNQFHLKKTTDSQAIRFINIAYLDKNKNHKLLISSFFNAFGNNEKYQLSIIGNGKEMNSLKAFCKQLGVSNINLKGYANQNEIVKELHQSDYFVLSSNYETFGVVLIEAMSCGLPVISTKCGGPESIILNEKLGLLCEKEDEESLSKALIDITKTKFDSQYIREYAIKNFSYEFLSKKLISIYSEII